VFPCSACDPRNILTLRQAGRRLWLLGSACALVACVFSETCGKRWRLAWPAAIIAVHMPISPLLKVYPKQSLIYVSLLLPVEHVCQEPSESLTQRFSFQGSRYDADAFVLHRK